MWTSIWYFYSDYTYLYLGHFNIFHLQIQTVLQEKAQDMSRSNLGGLFPLR